MLMFTHSWLLAHYLGERRFDRHLQDFYTYNICPDFLPAGSAFNAQMTHAVSRVCSIPDDYPGASFIIFHLMVDDISHHGVIKETPERNFNPDADGYSYRKGRALKGLLMELYQDHGEPIDITEAAYRSHMVIEMTFDLALYWELPDSQRILDYMCEAVNRTADEHLDRFANTVAWFYGVKPTNVVEAITRCSHFYNEQTMNRLMTLEGRVDSFFRKYGPSMPTAREKTMLQSIMEEGVHLVEDYHDFLVPTMNAIKDSGFSPPIP